MKSRLAGFAFLALLVAGGAFAYWHFYMPRQTTDGRIRVSGNIETTEAQVAFKIPGRVVQRLVDEGYDVKKGETIALLDTGDLECTVAMRKADLGVAEAALAALLAGSRPQEIASAKAAWEKAEHALADLEAGLRAQEIVAAEATVATAAAEENRCWPNITAKHRCSNAERFRRRNSTPPRPPTRSPWGGIARLSPN